MRRLPSPATTLRGASVIKRLLVFLLCLATAPAFGAITHFGTAENPADNGLLTDSAAQSITPPSSMVSGQLVYVLVTIRNATEDISIVDTGGQTWTAGTTRQSSSVSLKAYCAIFNGTWSTNPSWRTTNQFGSAFAIKMQVYSPSAGFAFSCTPDVAESYTQPSSTTSFTSTGQTPTSSASVVTIGATDVASDTITWSSLTAGWTYRGAANQIRSTQSSGLSISSFDKIQSSASATGSVTNTASASQSGIMIVTTYKETASTPTFSVAPAITARSTNSITTQATSACTDCTYYGVAYTDGLSTPTCTQIKAGQNSSGASAYKSFSTSMTANVAATGAFSSYTDGTIRDSAYCMNSTAGGDSAVSTIADIYKTPAFSVAPSVTATTSSSLTVGGTLDGPGTVYVTVCVHGSTTPSTTETRTGTCPGTGGTQASTSKSVTGADTLVLTGLAKPVFDVYVASSYGGQNGSRINLTSTYITAPTGTQFDILASIGTGSFCESVTSPSPAAGDVVEIDSSTDPGAYGVSVFGTCHLSYTGDDSRQRLCYRIYDDSVGDWMSISSPSAQCTGTRAALWFNNQAPIFSPASDTLVLKVGVAMTDIDLCARATDAEGDALTGAFTVGTPPTGLGLSGSDNCTFGGTPTVENESGTTLTFTATDIAGASADFDLTVYPIDTITEPDCTDVPVGDCTLLLQAAFLDIGNITLASSDTIAAGNVISQSPAAGTEQDPGTNVDVVVSRGTASGNINTRLRLQLGLH